MLVKRSNMAEALRRHFQSSETKQIHQARGCSPYVGLMLGQ